MVFQLGGRRAFAPNSTPSVQLHLDASLVPIRPPSGEDVDHQPLCSPSRAGRDQSEDVKRAQEELMDELIREYPHGIPVGDWLLYWLTMD